MSDWHKPSGLSNLDLMDYEHGGGSHGPNVSLGPTTPVHFMFGPNGMVAAFDASGQQVPEWQGTRAEIVTKLVRFLGPDVKVEIIGGGL